MVGRRAFESGLGIRCLRDHDVVAVGQFDQVPAVRRSDMVTPVGLWKSGIV